MADTAEGAMEGCATGTADTAMCTEKCIGMAAATALVATPAATMVRMSDQDSMAIAATVIGAMDGGIGVA